MMQKLSNEKALAHMDVLMNKVSMAKEAAALEDADKNGVIAGTPAGTEEIPVTVDSDACDKQEIKNPGEGSFAAEKHVDLKDSTGGDEVEDTEANKDGKADPVPTDFNAESIDKESGEKGMKEQERVQKQGKAILAVLDKKASEAKNPVQKAMPKQAEEDILEFEKLSAEEQEAVIMFKEAADAHYLDYVQSFAAGMQKKAEDVQALMDAKGLPEEEAAAVLDEVAAEDPSLVIPEEEGAMEEGAMEEGGEGELSEEDVAMLTELAGELEAAGVTPEEVAAAVAEIEAEDGGDVPVEEGAIAEPPMEDVSEEDIAKAASDRHETIKEVIRAAMQ